MKKKILKIIDKEIEHEKQAIKEKSNREWDIVNELRYLREKIIKLK